MVAFVRGVPVQALQGRFYLPADVCARHGLSAEDAYRAVRLRVARNGGNGTSGKASAPSLNDLDVDARERYERSAIALHNVIYDLASHAHRHVNTARDHLANADLRPAVPADDLARAWPVLMQAYPSVRFLERLEREAQFDVVHPAVVGRGGEWSLPLRMWLQNRRRVL